MQRLSTPKAAGIRLARYEYLGTSNDGWAPWNDDSEHPRDYYLGLVMSQGRPAREVQVVFERQSEPANKKSPFGRTARGQIYLAGTPQGQQITAYYRDLPHDLGSDLEDAYDGKNISELKEVLSDQDIEWKPPFVSWWVSSGRPLSL